MTGMLSTNWARPSAPIPRSRLDKNFVTYQYSATMRRVMVLEGPYEPWHAILFDVSPQAIEIVEQPLKINERVNEKQLTYTFDLKVLFVSGECFHFEFKAEKYLIEYMSGGRAPKKWDLVSIWSEDTLLVLANYNGSRKHSAQLYTVLGHRTGRTEKGPSPLRKKVLRNL
jgi:hypothetical protein